MALKLQFPTLCFALLFSFHSYCSDKILVDQYRISFAAPQTNELPQEAKKILDELPERMITLPLVVGAGLKSSDSYQALKANLVTVENYELQSQVTLDPTVEFSASRLGDKTEPYSPFSSSKQYITSYNLGFSKMFSTGTAFSFDLDHNVINLQYPSSGIDTKESVATFTISQSLWKDAFGTATRNSAEAGELLSDAALLEFHESTEQWVIDLIDFYYRAWYSQATVSAAKENYQRRQRLARTTSIRRKRGTAEQTDLLQVDSAAIQSQVNLQQAEHQLSEIWKQLVTQLKFPKEWINIDPTLIPMKLDEPVAESMQYCGTTAAPNSAPAESKTTQKFSLQAQAAQLQLEAAKNLASPDLKLNFSLGSNGVDPSFSETLSETFSASHPFWSIGLQFKMPLSGYAEEAQARTALANQERSLAYSSQAKSDLEVNWINQCSNLRRLITAEINLSEAYQKQNKRQTLEEKRFQIGRSNTLTVIQAGDDATLAELNWRQTQVAVRQAAWRVKRSRSELEKFILSLTQTQSETQSTTKE